MGLLVLEIEGVKHFVIMRKLLNSAFCEDNYIFAHWFII